MFSRKSEKLPPFHVMEVLERAHELEGAGRSIIHLEIGEPDFPTAPHICEAAMAALKAGKTKYTHSMGIPELREAVAEYYNSRFGLDISDGQVIVTSGTSPAMLLLFLGLLDKGDEVIMSNPYYACYPNFVEYQGGKPVFIYTHEDYGFSLEPDAVAGAITPGTKAILINSPCNPTGHVIPAQTLKAIAEVARDVPIISDEIYQGLIYKGKDHSMLEYTDNGYSRTFSSAQTVLSSMQVLQRYVDHSNM